MKNHRPNHRHVFVRSALSVGIAAALLGGTPAFAESTSARRDAPPKTLEEVLVTSQRRSEDIQQVPISIVARSGEDLDRQGVSNAAGLQSIVPSLSIQPQTSGNTFVNIRGVGLQQSNPTASNGIAWYVDNVYIPLYNNEVDAFYDVSDVEVLRGPQGTLVGSNANGGAIFINSVQPSFDKVKGFVRQQFGSFDDNRTEAAINLPLSDMFAARVAVIRETQDSFTNNIGEQPPNGAIITTNNQPGNVDYNSARFLLTFKPSDSFYATLRYESYSSKNDGPALKPNMAEYPQNPHFNPDAYDPVAASMQKNAFKIDYDTVQYYHVDGKRTGLNAVWNITDALELKSVTGYVEGGERDLVDIDASSASSNQTLLRKTNWRSFTQEFDLLSTSDSPLQWVMGVYYSNASVPLALTFSNPTNPPPINNISIITNSLHTNEAVFGSATYSFSPQWSATLGARYSHDELPFKEKLCTGFLQACGDYQTDDNKWTGTGKLNFQATPDTLFYASIASGYKSGGVNLHNSVPSFGISFDPPPFEPETNVVEELGVKTTMFDNHLRLSADVYNSDYKHYQIQQFLGGNPYTQGPGKAKIYGAEAEASAVFGALRFDLGGSYMNATVSEDFSYVQSGGAPLTVTSGTEMPYSPKSQFTAGVQYDFFVGEGTLTPMLQFQYVASQYVLITHEAQPQPDTQMKSHNTLDFRLTYTAPEHWSVQGYVTNLTDREYVASISASPQPAANGLLTGAPRQVGVKLGYEF